MRKRFAIAVFFLAAQLGSAANITTDTVWSGDHRVTESMTVLDGVTLRIDAGTTVQIAAGAIIRVDGRILAEGTATSPILFTRYNHHSGTGRWGRFRLINADGLNRFAHCGFFYGDGNVAGVDGDEAIISTRGTRFLLEDCEFRENLGDSVNPWAGSTATLRRCYFGPGGEGVHGQGSDIEEDSCTFAYRTGRSDASDIEGQGHNIWVHDCVFLGSDLDDGCDFDNCDGVVERCVFMNYLGSAPSWEFRCGGVTMNEGSEPTVRNNIFINCRQGVISKGESHPFITNCDFINCETDVAAYEPLEDYSRVGHPTIRNCIMWGTTSQTLRIGIDTRTGATSTVNIDYCDVDSTPTLYCGDPRVTCGAHIFRADPLFADGVDGGDGYDLHLLIGSPCIRTGQNGVDIGAFPFASDVPAWRRY